MHGFAHHCLPCPVQHCQVLLHVESFPLEHDLCLIIFLKLTEALAIQVPAFPHTRGVAMLVYFNINHQRIDAKHTHNLFG